MDMLVRHAGDLRAIGRGVDMAAVLSVFGALVFRAVVLLPILAVAGAAAVRIERGLRRLVWISTAVALLAGGLWLAGEAVDMAEAETTGQLLSALMPVLLQTRFGHLLLLRTIVLLAAIACFGMTADFGRLAAACVLAGMAVVTQAGMGHAAAMGGAEGTWLGGTEALHLLAAGAWLGSLVPLFMAVGVLPAAQARALSLRFSPLGFACVVVLAGTALVQALELIGSVPALIGTLYGRLALTKLLLFAILVTLAAVNRLGLTAALSGGEPERAKGKLRLSVALETVLGLTVVLVAGRLASVMPGIHAQPDWPFPVRPSLVALADPAARPLLLAAAGCAAFAALLIAAAIVRPAFRRLAVVGAVLLLPVAVAGTSPLFIEAVPTTFWRSPTGFAAASIARGAGIFAANCAVCHGEGGRGDGPMARQLPVPPADLTAAHLRGHTIGELFWYVSHGFAAPSGAVAMPGFETVLTEDERWDVIDLLLAREAGAEVAASGAWTQPVAAPDFAATCADGRAVVLHELRGRVVRIVADATDPPAGEDVTLELAGPGARHAEENACIALGPTIWTAYAIVAGVAPDQLAGTVFLVDANGWLRGRLHAGDAQERETIARIRAAPIVADIGGGGHPHQH
ncbi:MAG: CopD family protein [Acidisphaera sp.]|nr:CopD family protein [Acidisphaera sp.]